MPLRHAKASIPRPSRTSGSRSGLSLVTVWRWAKDRATGGVAALVPGKRGPKGPSKATGEVGAGAGAPGGVTHRTTVSNRAARIAEQAQEDTGPRRAVVVAGG